MYQQVNEGFGDGIKIYNYITITSNSRKELIEYIKKEIGEYRSKNLIKDKKTKNYKLTIQCNECKTENCFEKYIDIPKKNAYCNNCGNLLIFYYKNKNNGGFKKYVE